MDKENNKRKKWLIIFIAMLLIFVVSLVAIFFKLFSGDGIDQANY